MNDIGSESDQVVPAASAVSSPAAGAVSSPAASANNRAEARIDLAAIRDNTARLVQASGSAQVMAVVKADAYGHGLVPSGSAARQGGADWLGVALLDEALALRGAGDKGRILAWLGIPGDRFEECVAADVDISASARWTVAEIVSAAQALDRPARVHLEVDTGLGRAGAYGSEWPDLIQAALAAQSSGEISVVGLWSHLTYADSPRHPTIAAQLATFDESIELAERMGVRPEVRHLANSAATLALPHTHYDLVRPGIAVYGISPGRDVGTSASLGLRPAMTLVGRLAQVKRVRAGQGVSYAHQYVTKSATTLGLVPIGYADGIPRRSSGVGPVLAAGARRAVAGRMCMDQFVLDLGDDVATEGDEVILFGPGINGEPTAQDWAQACDTIAYEIVTCVGPRIPRVYSGGQ